MLVQIGHAGAINMLGIDSVMVVIEHEDTYPSPSMFGRGPVKVKDVSILVLEYTDADGKKQKHRFRCPDSTTANNLKDIVLKQVKELENVGATQALEQALKNV